MTFDEKRLAELNEGRSSKIYTDTVGKVTGGVGRNLTDKGFRDDEIDLMLRNDLQEAWNGLFRAFPWVSTLDDVRRAAVIDLVFNMGLTKFLKFKASIASIKAKDWKGAGKNLRNSLWFQQVGVRGPRIIKMIETGKWPWSIPA